MSGEFKIAFKDSDWLKAHHQRVREFIASLPTFLREGERGHLLLHERHPGTAWEYEVEIAFRPNALDVSVLSPTRAWLEDVPRLVDWLSKQTEAVVLDDDDEEWNFDN